MVVVQRSIALAVAVAEFVEVPLTIDVPVETPFDATLTLVECFDSSIEIVLTVSPVRILELNIMPVFAAVNVAVMEEFYH